MIVYKNLTYNTTCILIVTFSICYSSSLKGGIVLLKNKYEIVSNPHRHESFYFAIGNKGDNRLPLTLIIKNLASTTAPVIIGVYVSQNKFPDPNDQFKKYKFKPNGKDFIVKINNFNYGTYALALYQDLNRNGRIDKDIFGIPTEPYAFSNNYRPVIEAPKFRDCKFDYSSKNNNMTISMRQ